MAEPVTLAVSACLLGEKVRYDGGQKRDAFLVENWARFVTYIPICPEVDSGLPVPREPLELHGDPDRPRLLGKETRTDYTQRIRTYARGLFRELKEVEPWGVILKSKSPSCGIDNVTVRPDQSEGVVPGTGLFALLLRKAFPWLPIEEDEKLHATPAKENFIETMFVMRRWQAIATGGNAERSLLTFHSRHKYLVLAHSRKHLTEMGRLVASQLKRPRKEVLTRYERLLREALAILPTVGTHTDVLYHLAGYFKNDLPRSEAHQLRDAIEAYRAGSVGRLVPLGLLEQYAGKFGRSYLTQQWYLKPDPREVPLRAFVP